MGYGTTASGGASTSMGTSTTASGDASTSMGSSSAASGFGSTAMGVVATARSYAETSLGVWNTYYTPISESSWEALDRLFVIGNGTWGVPSDALVMLKNGATTLNGTLQINHVDGVAVVGSGPSADAIASGATVPVSGAGTRMMFLPGYGAFRAGSADGTEWDAAYIGRNSIAMGKGTTASGFASTAIGTFTTASGLSSTALGAGTIASGDYTTAMGASTTASGAISTAMGVGTNAIGRSSTAMGSLTNASGDTSTAMGESTTASGPSSTAMGVLTTARSFAETSLGFRNTEYSPFDAGSWDPRDRLFVVGNGYDAPSDALVMLKNGDTTFSGNVLALTFTPTSDRNRKTDIVPADTAAVLAGVATLPIATWKFKAETVTHLGPMAQDFAAAFHLGATDTGIATVDADGVALAAIQELNKRVNSLSQENAALKSEVGDLKTRLSAIEAKLVR